MKIKLEGVPLKIVDWSETSQIVTLLTDKLGKVTGIAKGAYRPKSAFDGPFDLLCRYQVLWLKGSSSLGQFTESFLYSRPLLFRSDLKVQFWALSCLERARDLLEQEQATNAYHEICLALIELLKGEDPQRVHNNFSIRLLKELGFGPVTTYCVIHGLERRRQGTVPYSPRFGGILCPQCVSQDASTVPLNRALTQRIQSIQQGESADPISDRDEKSLTSLLTQTIQHILGRPLKMARYCMAACWLLMISFLVGCSTSGPPEELYERAVVYLEDDAWIRGERCLNALEEKYPGDQLAPEGLWLLALDQQRRGELSDARKTLGRFLDRYPDHRHFDRALRRRFEILKKIFTDNRVDEGGRVLYEVSEDALDDMEETASYAPYSSLADEALILVADVRLGSQEFDGAEILYREVLSRVDRNSPLEAYAQFHLALSLWDRAVVRIRGFFDRYLRNPTEPLSESDRQVAVRFSDRYPEEAAREFREVVRRFPESEEAAKSRVILAEIEQLEAVRLLGLGDFYLFYGKIDSARHYYRRVTNEYLDSQAALDAQKNLDRILDNE